MTPAQQPLDKITGISAVHARLLPTTWSMVRWLFRWFGIDLDQLTCPMPASIWQPELTIVPATAVDLFDSNVDDSTPC